MLFYENLNVPFRQYGKHNDSMKCLTGAAGNNIMQNKAILESCCKYYQELCHQSYLFRDVQVNNRTLSLIPHNLLSQEGVKLLDQPISIEELHYKNACLC